MNLLLDTHIWLWVALHPERVGRAARREIERASNQLYLSPVSIWEAHHVMRSRKLRIREPFELWVGRTLAQFPLREAPFSFEAALAAAGIELPQSDIGDVYLAATAFSQGLTLVTNDPQLLACKWLKTLSND